MPVLKQQRPKFRSVTNASPEQEAHLCQLVRCADFDVDLQTNWSGNLLGNSRQDCKVSQCLAIRDYGVWSMLLGARNAALVALECSHVTQ